MISTKRTQFSKCTGRRTANALHFGNVFEPTIRADVWKMKGMKKINLTTLHIMHERPERDCVSGTDMRSHALQCAMGDFFQRILNGVFVTVQFLVVKRLFVRVAEDKLTQGDYFWI